MRCAALLFLIPTLAFAQDVPSLQRPNPALPITESLETLRARLGKAGGPFAAAQLALKPGGEAILQASKESKDPLVRLDATYGLSLVDSRSARRALGYLMGDPDPRVSGEAYVNLRRVREQALDVLREVALHGNEQAGNLAVWLEDGPASGSLVLEVAKTYGAPGREAALTRLGYSDPTVIPILEAAAHDPRPNVGTTAVRYLLPDRKNGLRRAALRRLIHAPDVAPRLALASALADNYSSANWDILVPLLTDPSAKVRLMLADVLVSNLFGSGQVMMSLPAIARLVDDPVKAVGDQAVKRLGEYAQDRITQRESLGWGTSPATPRLRHGAAKRLHGPMAFHSALILALLGDHRAYPALFERAHGGDRQDVAIMALGMLGDRRATPFLLGLTVNPNYRGNAFVALGFLRDPSTVPFLLKLVREHPRDDGIMAAYALGQMGDRSVTPALLAIATDPKLEPGYRLNYVEPLAMLGGPEVRKLLVRLFETVLPQQLPIVTSALVTLKDRSVLTDLERIASGPDAPRANEARHAAERLRSALSVSYGSRG
jgi:HEAT repeat protein